MTRPAAPPPDLAGYTYDRPLGSGGFADVFLYTQELPRRKVAVKVLRTLAQSPQAQTAFRSEADLMATLSSHPAIVTIHHAAVAPDGRPYLVMEYCPKPNLGVRYRRERISPAEALRIGVRLCGAVETVHRADILHRDIKPANVLVTEYNWPVLTDFGIAGLTADDRDGEALGMSVPWSPPESFYEPAVSTRRSDLYSLGATIYSLLAGRSPFEVPGGDNRSLPLSERIRTAPLAGIGRPDVPPELDELLARAMAKDPADRFASAVELARGLQRVEMSLHLAQTPLEVSDAAWTGPDDDIDGETRMHPPQVDPLLPAETAVRGAARPVAVFTASPPDLVPAPVEDTVMGGGARAATGAGPAGMTGPTWRNPGRLQARPVDDTAQPVAPGSAGTPAPGGRQSRRRLWVALGSGAALIAIVVTVVVVVLRSGDDPTDRPTAIGQPTGISIANYPPAADGLTGALGEDGAVFTWVNPDPETGDGYLWRRTDDGADQAKHLVEEATVTVPAEEFAGPTVCVEVEIRRTNGKTSREAARACLDVGGEQ